MLMEEMSINEEDEEKNVDEGDLCGEKKMIVDKCGWRRWVWIKEMNVRRFMNMNWEDECDEIYMESEREKLWVRRFVIFKSHHPRLVHSYS